MSIEKEAHEQIELKKKIGFRDVENKCCATCQHAHLQIASHYMQHLDVDEIEVNPTIFDGDVECKCTRHNLWTIDNPNYVVCNDYE